MVEKKSSSDVAYARETETLSRFKQLVGREDISKEEALEGLSTMLKDYDRLLTDVKLLTSVGDRLQRKLKSANVMLREQSDEIRSINENLQVTNTELKLTIDELTKTRAGRKAQTYVLTVTIILFFISELLEKVMENYLNSSTSEQIVAWGMKLLLVLLIKPLEGYIEQRLVRAAMNQKSRELLDRHTQTASAPTGGTVVVPPAAPSSSEPTPTTTAPPAPTNGGVGRPRPPRPKVETEVAPVESES
jgi:hypothetical protein